MHSTAGISLLVALVASLVPASPVVADSPPEAYLVRSEDLGLVMSSAAGAVEVSSIEVAGWRRLTIAPGPDSARTRDRIESELGIHLVPEYELEMFGPETEPLFPEQWNLANTGQTGGTVGADIGAIDAWSITTGDPAVVVAVVDSGVDITHPDLAAAIAVNPGEIAGNGIDDDGNGYVDDVVGWDFVSDDNDPRPTTTLDNGPHGTWVSGVVAARANGFGVAGVAPDVGLLPVRACTSTGCSPFYVAAGVLYAVDRGADVINLSLGGYVPQASLTDDPLVAAIAEAEAHGVLVVTAAGNDGVDIDNLGTDVLSPAGLPNSNILSVAASDDLDHLADFGPSGGSNYGALSVDIAAPGVAIPTTDPSGGHELLTGTSFSAPEAAGVAALMLSVNGGLTPAQMVDLIQTYSDPASDLTGLVASGARLDAAAPMVAARIRDIQSSVFRDDVVWLAAAGITKGCNPPDNDLFCPTRGVTRGQMAAFLVRALGLPAAAADHFVDDDGTTFEDDINRLAEAGITQGCGQAAAMTFCPDRTVSRGQMAAFLVRAFGYTATGSKDFVDDNTSIFEADIEKLAAAGITVGCNPPVNDHFCPLSPVTRGQMAAFLRRALS